MFKLLEKRLAMTNLPDDFDWQEAIETFMKSFNVHEILLTDYQALIKGKIDKQEWIK